MKRLTPVRAYRAIRWRLRNWRILSTLRYAHRGLSVGRDVRVSGDLLVYGPGKIIIGDGCEFAGEAGVANTLITASEEARIVIGAHCRLNGAYVFAASQVTIGSHCLIADSHLFDTDHHVADHVLREAGTPATPKPIEVADHVWICSRAAVLKGVHIGQGAVVGYRAVVRRDVPARAVVIGNPAQVVKYLGDDALAGPGRVGEG